VAFLASAFGGAGGKLAAVIIAVAVAAICKRQPPARLAWLMAGFALDGLMLAQQREAGLAVVEPGKRTALPARGAVAGLAIGPKAPAMEIFVAIGAAGKRRQLEFQETGVVGEEVIRNGCVAFLAGYLEVPAGQGKTGVRVIEFRRRFPPLHFVAIQTLFPHLPAMLVHVAGEAIAVQSQESTFQTDFLLQQPGFAGDVLFPVAGAALLPGVRPLQRIAGLGVVEIFLPALPVDDLEIPPVVVAVAIYAIPVFLPGVKPLICLNPIPEHDVAG